MLPRKLSRFELVEQLVHLVRVDTRLETGDEGANPELRRLHGFLGHSEPDPEGLIHGGFEALAAASDGALEPLGHIGIKGECRAHEGIMMSHLGDVKMSRESVARLGACRHRRTDTRPCTHKSGQLSSRGRRPSSGEGDEGAAAAARSRRRCLASALLNPLVRTPFQKESTMKSTQTRIMLGVVGMLVAAVPVMAQEALGAQGASSFKDGSGVTGGITGGSLTGGSLTNNSLRDNDLGDGSLAASSLEASVKDGILADRSLQDSYCG